MLIPEYDIIVAVFSFTVLVILVVSFFIAIIIQYQKRRQQHLLQMTNLKNQYDQELLRSQLEIQEQTLRNISQEIHDNIGQVLSLAKLQLHSLQQQTQWQQALQPTTDLISKSIGDLRDLSKSMHPDRIIDIGLAESINQELALLQKTKTIKTQFDHSGSLQKLMPEKEIIVFRMFQEMMNNVIKHSGAKHLWVQLNFDQNVFMLSVSDDGKGFAPDTNAGIGFNSLRTRAKIIEAALTINSTPGKGTAVQLQVPV